MADQDKVSREIVKEHQDALRSSLLSIDGKFFDRNDELLSEIQGTVRKIGRNYSGSRNISKSTVTQDLTTLILNSLGKSSVPEVIPNKDLENASGIRSLTQQMAGSDQDEQNLIQISSAIMDNIFRSIPEYRNIEALIPEISRVIGILARDIINRNEFTGRSINDGYEIDDPDSEAIILKAIRENIIEPNELEAKVRPWLEQALTVGAKPIALIPYSKIIEDVVVASANPNINSKLSMESWFQQHGASSFEDFLTLTPAPMSHRGQASNESFDLTKLKNFVITDNMVEECRQALQDDVRGRLNIIRSLESAIDPKVGLSDIDLKRKASFESILEDKGDDIRSSLEKIAEFVSDNVVYSSKRGNLSYSSFKKHVTDEDFRQQQMISSLAMDGKKNRKASSIWLDSKDEEAKKKGEKREVKFDVEFLSQVLVLPMDAEHVIPVVINGRHVGYYVIEMENANQGISALRSNTTSFTEIIKSIGSDKGLVTGELSDVTETGVYSTYSAILRSKLMSGGSDSNGVDNRLNKTLQQVALRAVATRMGDSSLIENKAFQDSTVELIRRGFILGKQVMYTFIPAENMIYYSPKEDDKGMPHSILDGCLMDAYIYLSSVMASLLIKLMKSADKEKVIVNMGLSKDISGSIQEIDRFFSTRNIAIGSMFQSLSSVLRHTGQYQRNIIPNFDGNLLYDIEALERVNDIDIDDEFTTNRLNSILSKMGVPPSILNLLNDSEFSRSIVAQHLEYRNNIVEYQSASRGYKNETQRLIRRLIHLMGLKVSINGNTETILDETKYYLDVRPPLRLEIEKSNDEIDQVSDLVDKLTTVLVGDGPQNDYAVALKDEIRKELFKKYFTGIEWEDFSDRFMERMVARGRETFQRNSTNDAVFAKIKAKVEKTMADEPDPENPDGGTTY